MTVEVYGRPNYQRFAETWCAILAARDGLEIVPGSVRVELKGGTHEQGKEPAAHAGVPEA